MAPGSALPDGPAAPARRRADWPRCSARPAWRPTSWPGRSICRGLADAEFERLPAETRALFDAFADGVNAAIRAATDRLPIEFDLLGYAPEPWTGARLRPLRRLVAMAAHRPAVGDQRPGGRQAAPRRGRSTTRSSRYQREHDDEIDRAGGRIDGARRAALTARCRLAPCGASAGEAGGRLAGRCGCRPASGRSRSRTLAGAASFADRSVGGSNNWVVAGSRSKSGKPIVASDPHMPYEAQSSFYEVHLSGGSFDVAGAGFVGYPGAHVRADATSRVGDHEQPLLAARPVPRDRSGRRDLRAATRTIAVRGRAEPIQLTVQHTSHGPIVDRILPPTAAPSRPGVRCAGSASSTCDWPSALLRLNRAQSVDEGMTAVRGWLSPTFSMLLADDDGPSGHIAFTNTRHDPRPRPPGARLSGCRRTPRRVARPHRPGGHAADPRPAGRLAGFREQSAGAGRRVPASAVRDVGRGHPPPANRAARRGADAARPLDVLADAQRRPRPAGGRPARDGRLDARGRRADSRADERQALELLRAWDREASVDSAAAAIWEVFWTRWVQAVAAVRFAPDASDFIANWMVGFSGHMLRGDDVGWFASDAIGARRDRRGVSRGAPRAHDPRSVRIRPRGGGARSTTSGSVIRLVPSVNSASSSTSRSRKPPATSPR